MPTLSFGEFLHSVRIRTTGTQIAKDVGISYVYLLDIEKGARPVPSNSVLMALADNLPLSASERETFFDLAAQEKGDTPLDISKYIQENDELVDVIRQIKKLAPDKSTWCELRKDIMLKIGGGVK